MTDHLSPMFIHTLFDIAAWLTAFLTMVFMRRYVFLSHPITKPQRFAYLTFLLLGAGLGAWALGSVNTIVSGQQGLGRSILGALCGAIIAIELFKKANKITTRSGAIFAAPIAAGILVGRLGCHLAGLEDFTYGIPTKVSWGFNYGDGLSRHPVALYESLSMGLFLCAYFFALTAKSSFWKLNGFYLFCIWYGVGRFMFEFLKPYGKVLYSLNLFQLACIGLITYGFTMIRTNHFHPENPCTNK